MAMHRLQITCPPNSNACDVKHVATSPAWEQIIVNASNVTRAADGTVVVDIQIDDPNWPPKTNP